MEPKRANSCVFKTQPTGRVSDVGQPTDNTQFTRWFSCRETNIVPNSLRSWWMKRKTCDQMKANFCRWRLEGKRLRSRYTAADVSRCIWPKRASARGRSSGKSGHPGLSRQCDQRSSTARGRNVTGGPANPFCAVKQRSKRTRIEALIPGLKWRENNLKVGGEVAVSLALIAIFVGFIRRSNFGKPQPSTVKTGRLNPVKQCAQPRGYLAIGVLIYPTDQLYDR